jgi:quaternary ammonium compound-resistance protein SugE
MLAADARVVKGKRSAPRPLGQPDRSGYLHGHIETGAAQAPSESIATTSGDPQMAWFILILAGLLEIGWAIGLKYTDGFTRPLPSVLTAAAIVISMVMLAWSARSLPIGTAYAVWVGIGASGAAILGMVLFGESRNPARLFFLGMLVVSIVGLRLSTPAEDPPGRAPTELMDS